MGHYISAYDSDGLEVAAIGYGVWNPNVKLLYRTLGMKEISGWSGEKNDVVFSVEDIRNSLVRIKEMEFPNEVQYDSLDPLIRYFTELQQPDVDGEKEKEKIERFLRTCLKVAKSEGKVTINFG